MELAETELTHGEIGSRHGGAAEPSVSSALEHLVAGSQGAITKRIDLALLEGQELLSRTFRGAALLGFGMVLAAGAWGVPRQHSLADGTEISGTHRPGVFHGPGVLTEPSAWPHG